MVKASERKVMAKEAIINHDVSISLICRTFTISETCYRYQPKLSDDNELIMKSFEGKQRVKITNGLARLVYLEKYLA